MKISKVRAVWFSATGTTEKVVLAVAGTLAERLGVPLERFCFNLPAAREEELVLGPEELAVVGVPVYAGRVPNLLLPYLRDKVKGRDAPAVALCLFGNRDYDDGLMELRNTLRDNGFRVIGAGAFVGEHAFSRTLGAGRPDGEDLALAETLAGRVADKVKSLTEISPEPVAVKGCEPVRPYYTPRDRHGNPINILKVKPVTDGARCLGCGLCARICPMGSIDPEAVSRVDGVCMKCCACVKGCPAGAKYFDDPGYLYHQRELEEVYARRADSEIFL